MPETNALRSLSVIIPTYNREKLLAKALEGYLAQSTPELVFELLVVDDGSTDGTATMVREFRERSPFPIRYLRQPNQGPAAARNLGIREAASSIVLFTDSDIVPERELVAQHLEWHRANPQTSAAVLGYVTWPEEIKATPFMRWYGENALFGYRGIRGKREIDFRFFYTCNLSLKTDFLRTCGQFDEEFKSAAWEDIELGFRLEKTGLRLLYNPQAIAFHHQFFTFEEACRKALANSAWRKLFFTKEAGQCLLAQRRRRRSGIKRFGKLLATGLGKAMESSVGLLDSGIPVPSLVYRSLYWYRVERQFEPMEGNGAKRM